MKTVLLVGNTGFIGSNLYRVLQDKFDVHSVSYKDIDSISSDYDIVINCSIHPDYRVQKYGEDLDIDYKLANKTKGLFVMFSSRKVYGSSDDLISYNEESAIDPVENYSENKVITEYKIREIKEDFLIFRTSNAFGFEPKRKSFLGFCIDQLVNNNSIVYDLGYKTKRDFIHIDNICDLVKRSLLNQIKGTYNLSSDIAYEIGDLASSLIIGYNNKSKFICTDVDNIKDQFVLSNKKLLQSLKIDHYIIDMDSIVKNIGRQLCKI